MPFRRGKQGVWYVRVPLEGGASAIRTTGSPADDLARDIEAALTLMKRNRQWRELQAIADGVIAFDTVRTAWASERLSEVGKDLDDIDLEPRVAVWHQELLLRFGTTARRGVAAHRTTPAHYLSEVRCLIPAGVPFRRSQFSRERLTGYLAARRGKPATKARARAALSSFATYLVREHMLAHNPVHAVPAPKVVHPEPRYLDRHESDRLIAACGDAVGGQLAAMEALTHATGMELAALRNLRVGHLDLARRRTRAQGTKKPWRDRTIDIEPWALPFLTAQLARRRAALGRALRPSDAVFTALDTERELRQLHRAHVAACDRAGIDAYTFHDSRHSYAVRYVAAGVPAEYVARQLGHKDTKQVNETYGRFRPSALDAARYQAMAAARDAELRDAATDAASDADMHAVPARPSEPDNETRYTPVAGAHN